MLAMFLALVGLVAINGILAAWIVSILWGWFVVPLLRTSRVARLRSNMPKAVCIIVFGFCLPSYADCVVGAKSKTSFVVLDSHTIMLKGGFGSDIIIKTFSFLNSGSQVTILKDDFCSFENAVLYIDGEMADANQVTKVN